MMEKEERIYLRISPDDKKLVEERAEKAGLSVSAYARKMVLEGAVLSVDPKDRLVLSGLANNLNQIAYKLNLMGKMPMSFEKATEELQELIQAIRHAYRQR